MEYILLIGVDVVVSMLGIVNMWGNIATIHWYPRTKLTEEDAPKYGKWMGGGTLTAGLSCLLTAVLQMVFHWEPLYWIIIARLAVGVAMMVYAQIKYNRGLFSGIGDFRSVYILTSE